MSLIRYTFAKIFYDKNRLLYWVETGVYISVSAIQELIKMQKKVNVSIDFVLHLDAFPPMFKIKCIILCKILYFLPITQLICITPSDQDDIFVRY